MAEDNQVNQRVTVAMLEHLGYCVDVVEDGVEAVSAATLVPYRAILMDCQIPVLNGYEATIEIRGREGASRSTPIIAVTSSVTESDRQRCLAVGMSGLLAKPVSVDALEEGMARWAPDPTGPDVILDPVAPLPSTTTGRPPADTSERPALDPDVVARLEQLGAATGEDLMGQVAVLFLADAETRMVILREALARADGPTLIESAHTMCGASASLGAADLARLCARLATDGAVSDPEEGKPSCNRSRPNWNGSVVPWPPPSCRSPGPGRRHRPTPLCREDPGGRRRPHVSPGRRADAPEPRPRMPYRDRRAPSLGGIRIVGPRRRHQ